MRSSSRITAGLGISAVAFLGLASASPWARAAEVELPRQTPWAKVAQQVGLTEISVDYSSPATRGRKVWGDLVPYDRLWIVGGNPAAKVRFSKDIMLGDTPVAAGTYVLLAEPHKQAWFLALYKTSDAVMTIKDYRPELEVARIKVQPTAAPHRERLTFVFSDVTDDSASLDLVWDDARVRLPIKTNTSREILTAIEGLDQAWRSYANAARYMLETKKDYDTGLKYIDQSLAMKEDWFSLWIKATLLAGKGNFSEAHRFAQKAYDLARTTDDQFVLEPELTKAIAKWKVKGDAEPRGTAKVAEPEAGVPMTASKREHDAQPVLPKSATPVEVAPSEDPPMPLRARAARLRRR